MRWCPIRSWRWCRTGRCGTGGNFGQGPSRSHRCTGSSLSATSWWSTSLLSLNITQIQYLVTLQTTESTLSTWWWWCCRCRCWCGSGCTCLRPGRTCAARCCSRRWLGRRRARGWLPETSSLKRFVNPLKLPVGNQNTWRVSVLHFPVWPPSTKTATEVVEKGSARTRVSKSIRILQMSLLDLQIVYVHGSASELGGEFLFIGGHVQCSSNLPKFYQFSSRSFTFICAHSYASIQLIQRYPLL